MRENYLPLHTFYSSFREWIDEKYSNINQEAWDQIMFEDAEVDYETVGSGILGDPADEEVINDGIVPPTNSD